MRTTPYTRDELNKMHLDIFRDIASQRPVGHTVGVRSWELKVSNTGASLATYYRVKDDNGNWSEIQEFNVAL